MFANCPHCRFLVALDVDGGMPPRCPNCAIRLRDDAPPAAAQADAGSEPAGMLAGGIAASAITGDTNVAPGDARQDNATTRPEDQGTTTSVHDSASDMGEAAIATTTTQPVTDDADPEPSTGIDTPLAQTAAPARGTAARLGDYIPWRSPRRGADAGKAADDVASHVPAQGPATPAVPAPRAGDAHADAAAADAGTRSHGTSLPGAAGGTASASDTSAPPSAAAAPQDESVTFPPMRAPEPPMDPDVAERQAAQPVDVDAPRADTVTDAGTDADERTDTGKGDTHDHTAPTGDAGPGDTSPDAAMADGSPAAPAEHEAIHPGNATHADDATPVIGAPEGGATGSRGGMAALRALRRAFARPTPPARAPAIATAAVAVAPRKDAEASAVSPDNPVIDGDAAGPAAPADTATVAAMPLEATAPSPDTRPGTPVDANDATGDATGRHADVHRAPTVPPSPPAARAGRSGETTAADAPMSSAIPDAALPAVAAAATHHARAHEPHGSVDPGPATASAGVATAPVAAVDAAATTPAIASPAATTGAPSAHADQRPHDAAPAPAAPEIAAGHDRPATAGSEATTFDTHAAPAAPAPLTSSASPAPAPVIPRTQARTSPASPSFVRQAAPRTPRDRRRTLLRAGAIGALSLLLGLQLLLADRAALAADARWRPVVASLCGALGCAVPPWREPRAFHVLERDVRAHPQRANVLRVSARVRNDARWAQPWPVLRLTLSDVHGRGVASRAFQPREYLGGAPTQSGLASGQSAALVMEIVEPGPQAVAFTFDFE